MGILQTNEKILEERFLKISKDSLEMRKSRVNTGEVWAKFREDSGISFWDVSNTKTRAR